MRSFGIAAAVLLAGMAYAQPAPAPLPSQGNDARSMPGMEQGRAEREARRAEWERRRTENEARREDDMATLLDLKPAQRGRLHAFLASMRPDHGRGGMSGDGKRMAGGDAAPDRETFGTRLAARQAELDADTREEQARLAAARAFYDGLDTSQRAKFEALSRLDHPRHGPGGPMPMEHGPGKDGTMPPPPPR